VSSKAENRVLAIAVLVLAAAYFAVGVLWRRSASGASFVAYDFYGWTYPSVVYEWRSIWRGSGLLWNPYQDCGQPFFANGLVALLYPVNLVFGFLGREPAVLTTVVLHLSIAGIGTYLLCREMRLSRPAALSGALAFELGWASIFLASWSPTHIGVLAWLPVAMWRAERLIRRPDLRGALLLALVLAMQQLPGFPQIVFFTYQLIALRLVWALLFRQTPSARTLLGAAALGLVLPVFLVAVQLVPSLELVRDSVRGGSVGGANLGPGFSWALLDKTVRSNLGIPGNTLPFLIAGLAIAAAGRGRRWADAAFWALVTCAYFVLSLGPGDPLFGLYARLPLGTAFRDSQRLLWVTSFALAVLVALGIEAALSTAARSGSSWRLLEGVLVALAAALWLLVPGGLRAVDAGMVAVLAAIVFASSRPRLRRLGRVGVPALVLFNGAFASTPPPMGLRRGDIYGTHADVFAFVRQRMTPQDRLLIVGGYPNLGLMPKSATLFRLPNIHDYAPLESRRYAELFTYMRTGRPMRDIGDWYWLYQKLLPRTLQRPLFDLTAARYILVTESLDTTARAFHGGLRLLRDEGGVRVYENEQALPRARYVGRAAVLGEAGVLPALARGTVDARRVAALDRELRSGFTGTSEDAKGSVEFVADEPQRVVLRVRASEPGFLFLADQDRPGWKATVDGVEREIVRADHAFRLVEVPKGDSEVVFTYRPLSLPIGAAVSLAAIIAFAILWRRSGRPRGGTSRRSFGLPSAARFLIQ